MSLILKNTTASPVQWGGEPLDASSQRDVQFIEHNRLIIDSTFMTALYALEAVINNDGADVPPEAAESLLKNFGDALQTSFIDKTGRPNSFKAKTAQEALEEIDFREELMDPTGFREHPELYSDLTFDDATITMTISPVGDEFYYYIKGEKFIVTEPVSLAHADIHGLWFYYFDQTGTLVTTQTPWTFEAPIAFVAMSMWSSTDHECIYCANERHGFSMPWAVHKNMHKTAGARHRQGEFHVGDYLINQDGSLDSHVSFSVQGGTLYDEDLDLVITDSATPTEWGEQTLSPQAMFPMFYKWGPEGEWRRLATAIYPMALNPGGRPFWNEFDGINWVLTEMPNNYYASTPIIVTNSNIHPVRGIVPQNISTNAVDATRDVIASMMLEGTPLEESVVLILAIYDTQDTFTNSVKARLVAISDAGGLETQVDRYAVLGNYNGKALTGRYLLVVPGDGSDTSPFYFPDDSYVRTVTAQTSAINTYTIGFFEANDLINPRLEVSVVNESAAEFDVSTLFIKGERMSVRLTSGDANDPAVRFWVQTTIGVGLA